MTLAHWDEVEGRRVELGHLRSTWTDLGRAAGSVGVRLRRIQVDPGGFSTPAHVHKHDEEIFFVLGGSGLSWQDGKTYDVRPGDCIVHLEGAEVHTLKAGDDGLDVIVFGATWERSSGAHLPRAGVIWSFPSWFEAGPGKPPFEREAELGPPDCPDPSRRPPVEPGQYDYAARFAPPRPGPRIVNLGDCEAEEIARGDSQFVVRNLGVTAGSRRTGIRHHVVAPTKMGWPPHCHAAEEELLVVLEGEGTLLLEDEEHPLQAGHVVSRPPGTRVAHALVAGAVGLTYLAYGTREPNDIAYYPRSNKVFLRGIGVMGRIERLDYWDGEL